jgi:hypothetical protein
LLPFMPLPSGKKRRSFSLKRAYACGHHEDGLVEAAGVEPVTGIENTQVIDFKKGSKGSNGQKGKSTVQTLYKIGLSSAAACAYLPCANLILNAPPDSETRFRSVPVKN